MEKAGRKAEFLQEFLGVYPAFLSPLFYFAHGVLPVMFFRKGREIFDQALIEGVKIFEPAWDMVCAANGDPETSIEGWSADSMPPVEGLRMMLLTFPEPREWNDPYMLAMVLDERNEDAIQKRFYTLEYDPQSFPGKPVLREVMMGNGYFSKTLVAGPAQKKAFLAAIRGFVARDPHPVQVELKDIPPYMPYIFGRLYAKQDNS